MSTYEIIIRVAFVATTAALCLWAMNIGLKEEKTDQPK